MQINYKSDLKFLLTLVTDTGTPFLPDGDFTLTFFVANPGAVARVTTSRINNVYEGMRLTDEGLLIIINAPRFGIGRLLCELKNIISDTDFSDGNRTQYNIFDTNIELVNGAGDDIGENMMTVVLDTVIVKMHFEDLTQEEIALLQKPAVDKAAELDSKLSDTAKFLRLADLAEEERGTNESTRIDNENARGQTETGREQAEASRVTAENARTQSEDSRTAAETERAAAEASRVAAESGRVTAESARETSFSESKTAADAATEAANDAAVKFEAAIVQVVGPNTDKVISQNALTVLLNAITGNASLQGNVIAEAIVLLINEVNGLKSILSQGLGDIRVTSITSDNIPQYMGQPIIVFGSGSPVTNNVLPGFTGQMYIDTTNRHIYSCPDSSSSTYWKPLD